MPGLSSRGIFLSYRREDAAPYARLLEYQLTERFPDARVFIDLDSIEAGLDFAEVIAEAVDSCAVLVALIGRQWATLADEEGHRRIEDPDDLVRFEIQTALERGLRVIPVLVDGAKPLRQPDMPPELRKLARLNAHKLSYDRYQDDAGRLLDLIGRVLAAATDTRTAQPSQAAATTSPPTYVVDAHDQGDFTTLGAAIQAVQPGDRILVQPGPYGEGLVVDRPLEIPVAGKAATGQPIMAVGGDAESLLLPLESARRDNVFAVKVRGDSMTEDGLADGDYVIVDPSTIAQDRDLVVVQLEGPGGLEEREAIVRRVRLNRDGTLNSLESSNPGYPRTFLSPADNPTVVGKVIGVFRPAR